VNDRHRSGAAHANLRADNTVNRVARYACVRAAS